MPTWKLSAVSRSQSTFFFSEGILYNSSDPSASKQTVVIHVYSQILLFQLPVTLLEVFKMS